MIDAEQLYREQALFVYRLGLSYCGDAEQAEELVQEVFVKALAALSGFRGEASVRTWIGRIALTTLWNQQKRERRSARQDAPLTDKRAPALRPIDEAQIVGQALERLSPMHRAVLVLFAVEELSHGEIALMLGISLGTAWSRYARARAALAEALGPPGLGALPAQE